MQIDLSCPIENQGTIVKSNSETNKPYLLLKLFNLSEKIIDSVEFEVFAYDSNGAELGCVPVALNELNAQPKSFFAESKAISLVGIDDAKHFVISVKNTKFEDGTTYEPSENHTVDVDDSEASIDDAMLLRQFIPEAVCFSSEKSNYWRCVCGRANFIDSKYCVRCGRNKDEIIKKFSSRSALTETATKLQEEEEARINAENEAKKAKRKKNLLTTLIILISLAVIFVAGMFVRRGVLMLNAKKAVENGNYLTAYENYSKVGSKKAAEIMKYVQGNTSENLMFQSGLIASDNENYYYVALDNTTYNFKLVKENKDTKEKTVLTDAAGGSLNVTNDWIYFVDVENSYVKRISKDGQSIESVLETPVSYLITIGDSMYYIKTDYDNPNKLSEEQCQTLASQGQMDTFKHLYKMDLNTKKIKLVTDENIYSCSFYNDEIYYLTENEDEWQAFNLCSVNLDGKSKQVIVDVPVASFIIKDDKLYYVNMYNTESKGNSIQSNSDLDYSIICKNLITGETSQIGQEYLTTYMNSNSEKLFFIALNREEFFNSMQEQNGNQISSTLYSMDYATGEIKQLIEGDVQIFNVCENEIIVYIASQGMCRVKSDGSGFEQILTENVTEQKGQIIENTEY